MPSLRFLNLAALALVAIVALSSLPVPVNALVADRAQVARHVHGHNAVAKRKRDSSGQCQPRPSSSTPTPTPTPTSTPTPSPTDTPVPSTTTTSTTSSSPAASPTAPASSNGQLKWGLAWGYDPSFLGNFANLRNVGFIYTWTPNIPSEAWNYPNLQRMPMLWGWNQIQSFQQTVHPGYAQYAIGPNEPNEPGQSNISPSDAYGLWMEYINPLAAQGYTLVSPACTDDDAGIQWYQEFFALCDQPNSGCVVNVVAFHSYNTDPQHLIDYANTLHNTYGRNVMITEFADQNFSGTGGQPSEGEVWDYAGKVKAFVDNTSWITGVFPFGLLSETDLQNLNVDTWNGLIDGNGNPTALANFYFNQ